MVAKIGVLIGKEITASYPIKRYATALYYCVEEMIEENSVLETSPQEEIAALNRVVVAIEATSGINPSSKGGPEQVSLAHKFIQYLAESSWISHLGRDVAKEIMRHSAWRDAISASDNKWGQNALAYLADGIDQDENQEGFTSTLYEKIFEDKTDLPDAMGLTTYERLAIRGGRDHVDAITRLPCFEPRDHSAARIIKSTIESGGAWPDGDDVVAAIEGGNYPIDFGPNAVGGYPGDILIKLLSESREPPESATDKLNKESASFVLLHLLLNHPQSAPAFAVMSETQQARVAAGIRAAQANATNPPLLERMRRLDEEVLKKRAAAAFEDPQQIPAPPSF